LVGWLPEGSDDRTVATNAARHNIHVWPLSLHCLHAQRPPALLLGYSGTKERDIRRGIDALGRALATRPPT